MQIVFKPNPLSYPGRLPGLNLYHPASSGFRFSAIPTGNDFISISPLAIPTLTATVPTYSIDGALGPVGVYTSSTNSNAVSFGGTSTTADTAGTLAAIFRLADTLSTYAPLNTSNTSNGWAINLATTVQVVLPGTVVVDFGLTLTAGVPYFVAVSSISGSQVAVLINLNTGKVVTGTGASAFTAGAQNGAVAVGGWSHNAQTFSGNLAAVMWSAVFLPLPQLLQWAYDPWSFWYPNNAVFPPVEVPLNPPPPAIGRMSLIMM